MADEALAAGSAALKSGRWDDARAAFETVLVEGDSAEACFGAAAALWWLGETRDSVARCTRAYSLFRRAGDIPRAVRCAAWLAVTYKSNYANFAAAAGWTARAERLLEGLEPGPLHGWIWLARAYKMPDLEAAHVLTERSLDIARMAGDVDLELVAQSQLGLITVGQGHAPDGFALIDEAMAAALAGEGSSLDTVVYACCDMLNACHLTSDLDRAAQWCTVADDFVETYGCPFLYAECRVLYGGVLVARGRWADAERELVAGLRITDGPCPGLHAKALTSLAALRVRQGRVEEADQLLWSVDPAADTEHEAVLCRAALLLARDDAAAACRALEHCLHKLDSQPMHLAAALAVLVEAHVATGDLDAAAGAAGQLTALCASVGTDQMEAVAGSGRGRVALALGDNDSAAAELEAALTRWSHVQLPFEVARARFDLARALRTSGRDLAVVHARQALEAFDGLGAALEGDRAAAFLRTEGEVARIGRKGVGTLTAREQEVLRLLGAGLSNPEIAARLFVSRKTASHHVSSILAKLDLRNRAEAAAYSAGTLGWDRKMGQLPDARQGVPDRPSRA